MNFDLATAYRTCSVCFDSIKPGELRAGKRRHGDAHATCAELLVSKTPCPSCWLVGPCDC